MERINLKLTFDSREVTGFEKDMRKQVPYATALALTNAAKLAQARIRSDLPKRFIIRRQWTSKGIAVQRAEKKDWPNCFSVVGSRDNYMVDHEQGNDRKAKSKAFSIPKRIRTNVKQNVPRSKWPARILGAGHMKVPGGGRHIGSKNGVRKKPTPFIAMTKSGTAAIFVRTGKPIGRPKRQRLKLLYILTRNNIRIKRTNWLTDPTVETIQKVLPVEFYKAMARALSTKKA